MKLRPDGKGSIIPSLDRRFSQEDVSVDLTMCGLLVEQAEEMTRLYAEHRDWAIVEERWFDERIDGRSTRGSSRKVYRVLSSRFKTASGALPSISKLPTVFDLCESKRDKAQVLYFYLLEEDPLVQFVVHEYVRRMEQRGVEALNFEQDIIRGILDGFYYADGEQFDYAESTTTRWGQGLRSVMREIGVLGKKKSLHGRSPNLGTTPLLVASGYSWEKNGKDWLSTPRGWLYLFQPQQYRDSLAEWLVGHESWEASGIHGELRVQPVEDTYEWAESTGGET